MADETGSNPIAQAIAAIATVILTILGLAHFLLIDYGAPAGR